MNSQFPPLYPEEAYSAQNNARAFMENKNELNNKNFEPNQNPLSGLLNGMNGANPILPLLIKMMSGSNNALGDILKINGEDSSSPLMNILSNFGNKKTSPQESREKEFPD